jgi:hypothetical protein
LDIGGVRKNGRREAEGGGGRRRETVRGSAGAEAFEAEKKGGGNCFIMNIAGFVVTKKFCYEVFAKQKKTELAGLYYCGDLAKGVKSVPTSVKRDLLVSKETY